MSQLRSAVLASALMLGLAGFAPPAHAVTVSGAVLVEITSASGNFIQIGEVIAIQAFTGINVALAVNGGSASSPGYTGAAAPSFAIDGVYPASYPSIFHSNSTGDGTVNRLDITLGAPADLASLTIYGRQDCCQIRDIFNINIYNSLQYLLYSGIFDGSNVPGGDIEGVGANIFNGSTTVQFDVVPLPAALPLFAAGLGAMGYIGWWKRRKALA